MIIEQNVIFLDSGKSLRGQKHVDTPIKEEVVGYHSKYDGLRAHRVCINHRKDGLSNHRNHDRNYHFFKNNFFYASFFT